MSSVEQQENTPNNLEEIENEESDEIDDNIVYVQDIKTEASTKDAEGSEVLGSRIQIVNGQKMYDGMYCVYDSDDSDFSDNELYGKHAQAKTIEKTLTRRERRVLAKKLEKQ